MKITLLLLLTSSLFAKMPQENADITSDHISYDGELAILNGNVHLSHLFGKMEAGSAKLTPDHSNAHFPFSKALLNENVCFHFEKQFSLHCDEAVVDFTKLSGELFAKTEKICFQDFLESAPLQIKSNQAEFQLIELDPSHYDLLSLITKEDVDIDYDTSFHLTVDHALFQKSGTRGILSCFSTSDHPCHLSHFDDEIFSEQITLDLNQNFLEFTNPYGQLSTALFPKSNQGACKFSAGKLSWDQTTQDLLL
ncbi:MAG: hypothetical protein KAR79_04695, partial [Simkaniaceae bacterium]|nr:hypothetical protein [Simkaniaceae bacterium]